ncbi:MAG: hypothetical protein HY261_08870 [Chloroflexi bacterium]|nr:hypothetical protein [Chloroflexota bacterium]
MKALIWFTAMVLTLAVHACGVADSSDLALMKDGHRYLPDVVKRLPAYAFDARGNDWAWAQSGDSRDSLTFERDGRRRWQIKLPGDLSVESFRVGPNDDVYLMNCVESTGGIRFFRATRDGVVDITESIWGTEAIPCTTGTFAIDASGNFYVMGERGLLRSIGGQPTVVAKKDNIYEVIGRPQSRTESNVVGISADGSIVIGDARGFSRGYVRFYEVSAAGQPKGILFTLPTTSYRPGEIFAIERALVTPNGSILATGDVEINYKNSVQSRSGVISISGAQEFTALTLDRADYVLDDIGLAGDGHLLTVAHPVGVPGGPLLLRYDLSRP